MPKKSNSKRPEIYITGEAVWPKLDTPDSYMAPGAKEPKVEYKTNLRVTDDEIKRFRAEWSKLAKETLEAEGVDLDEDWRPKLPIKKDKKDKTLTLYMASKNKPPAWDAKNHKLPEGLVIGGGSKIKVKVSVNVYPMQGGGVNLYLNGVQVLDLKAGTNRDVSPFEETEGYTRDEDTSSDDQVSGGGSDEDTDEIPF